MQLQARRTQLPRSSGAEPHTLYRAIAERQFRTKDPEDATTAFSPQSIRCAKRWL
jgi:hypothetical protein